MTDPGSYPPPGGPAGASPGSPPPPSGQPPEWSRDGGRGAAPPGYPRGPGYPMGPGYRMRGRYGYGRPMIHAAMRRRGLARIGIGVFLLAIGIVLTLADAATFGTRGGFLLVRWGFIVFGVLGIVRGGMILSRASRFR